MSLNNRYETKWADGTYSFALNLAQIEELQRQCSITRDANGVAIPEPFGRIYTRVLSGEFYVKDLTETLRLGLIGGGTPPTRAKELIDTYVVGVPFGDYTDENNNFFVCVQVLKAAMDGVAPKEGKEEPKKPEDEAGETKAS